LETAVANEGKGRRWLVPADASEAGDLLAQELSLAFEWLSRVGGAFTVQAQSGNLVLTAHRFETNPALGLFETRELVFHWFAGGQSQGQEPGRWLVEGRPVILADPDEIADELEECLLLLRREGGIDFGGEPQFLFEWVSFVPATRQPLEAEPEELEPAPEMRDRDEAEVAAELEEPAQV
jgi:hypothetical protein